MQAAPVPILETLLIRYNQQLGRDLGPAPWADRPLTWHQQELFGTPEVSSNLYLTVSTWHKVVPLADGLLTFLKIKGIELTLNAPEGALLPSQIQRKISNGVQSRLGAICRSRLLTVTTTLRQQCRDVWRFQEQA
jgi:hypothetical protein